MGRFKIDYGRFDLFSFGSHFVPNLTFGAPLVKCLRKNVSGFLDCHLMVSEPRRWMKEFAAAGANQFTYHYEVDENHESFCKEIRAEGMKVGIALKPKTQVDERLRMLIETNAVDLILVMTVEPGFGGQKFMGDMMTKVAALRTAYPYLNIQVDGGVSSENINIVAEAGANLIVSGSGIVNNKEPKKAIEYMRERVKSFLMN